MTVILTHVLDIIKDKSIKNETELLSLAAKQA